MAGAKTALGQPMSNPVRNTQKIEGLAGGGRGANHQLQVLEISIIIVQLKPSDAAAKDRYLSGSMAGRGCVFGIWTRNW